MTEKIKPFPEEYYKHAGKLFSRKYFPQRVSSYLGTLNKFVLNPSLENKKLYQSKKLDLKLHVPRKKDYNFLIAYDQHVIGVEREKAIRNYETYFNLMEKQDRPAKKKIINFLMDDIRKNYLLKKSQRKGLTTYLEEKPAFLSTKVRDILRPYKKYLGNGLWIIQNTRNSRTEDLELVPTDDFLKYLKMLFSDHGRITMKILCHFTLPHKGDIRFPITKYLPGNVKDPITGKLTTPIIEADEIEEVFYEAFINLHYENYNDARFEKIIKAEIIQVNMPDSNELLELKAFNPTSDRAYQDLTLTSISNSKLCLVESWIHLNENFKYSGIHRRTKARVVQGYLKDKRATGDPFWIKFADIARSGKIFEFFLHVTTKFKSDQIIYIHGDQFYYKFSHPGKYEKITEIPDDIIIYYYKNAHIEPVKSEKIKKLVEKIKKYSSQYGKKFIGHESLIVDPVLSCTFPREKDITRFAWDVETHPQSGKLRLLVLLNEETKESFTFKTIEEFYAFLKPLMFVSNSKTRPKGKIKYYQIYAHNASHFDNAYITKGLNCEGYVKKPIFDGSTTIKYFKLGENIEFKDSSLLIPGKLSTLIKTFDIKITGKELNSYSKNYYSISPDSIVDRKEAYPYKFADFLNIMANKLGKNPQEINYITNSVKNIRNYFNNDSDFDHCEKLHKKYNRNFDFDEYTEYYCFLDCLQLSKILTEYEKVSIIKPKINISQKSFNDIKYRVRRTYSKITKGTKDHFWYKYNKRTRRRKIKLPSGEKIWKTLYVSVPIPDNCPKELRDAIKSRDPEIRSYFLRFARKLLSFNPLNYITAPSASISKFFKFYNKYCLFSPPKEILDIEALGMRGGVTDLFKLVAKNIHKDDINSSYPNVMLGPQPIRYIRSTDCKDLILIDTTKKKLSKERKRKMKLDLKYFVEHTLQNRADTFIISIEYEDRRFMPNIYSHNKNKSLISAQVMNNIVVKGSELKLAVKTHILNNTKKHGCSPRIRKLTIHKIIHYQTAKIFEEFITETYAKRLEIKKLLMVNPGDPVLELKSASLKLDLNSVYGKFAQKDFSRNEIVQFCEFKKLLKSGKLSGYKLLIPDNFIGTTSDISVIVSMHAYNEKNIGRLVQIASNITAQARVNIFEKAYLVGCKNMVYMDTDAIVYTGKRLPKRYLSPCDLGLLWSETLEHEGYKAEKFIGLAPKTYAVKLTKEKNRLRRKNCVYKFKHKGIRKIDQGFLVKNRLRRKKESSKFGKLVDLSTIENKDEAKFNLYEAIALGEVKEIHSKQDQVFRRDLFNSRVMVDYSVEKRFGLSLLKREFSKGTSILLENL